MPSRGVNNAVHSSHDDLLVATHHAGLEAAVDQVAVLRLGCLACRSARSGSPGQERGPDRPHLQDQGGDRQDKKRDRHNRAGAAGHLGGGPHVAVLGIHVQGLEPRRQQREVAAVPRCGL